MKKIVFLFLLAFTAINLKAQIQAAFSAEEAMSNYYEQGWDDSSSLSGWTLNQTNANHTWGLTDKPLYSGQQPFSSIDVNSKYSLAITYDSNNIQDERVTSPLIDIKSHSVVEFYSLFCAVWLYNTDWTFSIIDVEKSDTVQLVSGFKWSQEQAFTGPSWVKFHFDLAQYTNKKCKFEFRYKGIGGDYVLIDGFKLRQKSISPTATITVNEGDSVHFTDQSTDTPTTWHWVFDGGTPAISNLQTPAICYAKAGTYGVKMTASDGIYTSSASHDDYIIVKVQAPTAHIGLPSSGYLSPWVACFIPVNTPVRFNDLSTGTPTSWSWEFSGSTPLTSFDQNPTVTYEKEGTYSFKLEVSNSVGTSSDFMVDAIQAGGSQDIWNIELNEYDKMGTASLGWYGYYAGTNWLGMTKFAEAFAKPEAPASIDSISIYFDKVNTITPDTLITVSVCPVDANGMPGKAISSGSVKASNLIYDKDNIKATLFKLDQEAAVDTPFFIVVSGIPNNSNNNDKDDISILSVVREKGQKSTTYHLLEDWDANDKPTGNYTWYKNTDTPVSMALTAHLTYKSTTPTVIRHTTQTMFDSHQTCIYGLNGTVRNVLQKGINLVRMSNGMVKKVVK